MGTSAAAAWRSLSLLLALLSSACCGSTQPITFEQAWVQQAAAERAISTTCASPSSGPTCLGLVGVFSHPYYTERRMRIRETWLRHRTPALDFVFVLALPDIDPELWSEPNRLVEDYVRWEWDTHHDLVLLNVSEQDSHSSDAAKGHAWFTWASRNTRGQYQYYIKLDDDTVINPYQLRLAMTFFPRHERVFWGRPLHKRGWPTRIHIGPLYLLSHDLATALANTSHTQFILDSDLPVPHILEDLRMSSFLRQLVPENEWLDALPCQIHDHPDANAVTQLMYHYSNQSVAVHQVKDQYFFIEAFSAILPHIETMAQDCAEWRAGAATGGSALAAGEGGTVGRSMQAADLLRPPVAEKCRKWYFNTSCYIPPGVFVPPDPDIKYRQVHHTIGAMVLSMVAFSVLGIGGAVALERFGGCAKLCR